MRPMIFCQKSRVRRDDFFAKITPKSVLYHCMVYYYAISWHICLILKQHDANTKTFRRGYEDG